MVAKMRENAQSLVQSSSKEVMEAEAMLEDAEKRWEVIDIDEEPDESLNNDDSRKKKRKVSVVSPRGSNSNNNSAGNYSAPDVAQSPSNRNSTGDDARTGNNSTAAAGRSNSINRNRTAVEVWRQAVHLHLPLPRHLQKIMSLE